MWTSCAWNSGCFSAEPKKFVLSFDSTVKVIVTPFTALASSVKYRYERGVWNCERMLPAKRSENDIFHQFVMIAARPKFCRFTTWTAKKSHDWFWTWPVPLPKHNLAKCICCYADPHIKYLSWSNPLVLLPDCDEMSFVTCAHTFSSSSSHYFAQQNWVKITAGWEA